MHSPSPFINERDERLRRFLAYSLTGLMFLLIIAFILTRDPTVLAATTIFALASSLVYPYYFRRRRK
jgi:putative flippase GtrA